MVDNLNKDEWSSWKTSKGTRFFLQHIFDKREGMKEELAEGRGGADLDQFIGQCQAYRDVIEFITHKNEFEFEEKDALD